MPDVLLPKWGVSMKEATIVAWHKAEGDQVAAGEPLVDLVTDKVDMTFEAPFGGTLVRILAAADETVAVGAALAVIE
jgi:pyruvate/2-oxoglutarate dehydrogenase complex dihydrolipoamide acyltransferase (E2) component